MMSWRQPASNTKPQFVKSMRRPAALGRALGLRREPGDACLAHPASIARPMAGASRPSNRRHADAGRRHLFGRPCIFPSARPGAPGRPPINVTTRTAGTRAVFPLNSRHIHRPSPLQIANSHISPARAALLDAITSVRLDGFFTRGILGVAA